MKNKKVLIVGSGNIALTHKKSIKKISKKISISRIASRKFNQTYLNKKKNFDFIIICSPATKHFNDLKLIEKNFKKLNVLIEKPLFDEYKKINPSSLKNRYFIGYNLRFHPVVDHIKKFITKKKVFFVNTFCTSFLPDWRKKDYKKSVSAKKKLGGGVLLELSHEIDYINWIFKNLKIDYSLNKKISNLKINTDDILCMLMNDKNNTIINIVLNFFSQINNRKIHIDGKDFSLSGDLIKNELIIKKNYRNIKKKFGKIDTYYIQNKKILSRRHDNLCNLKEGLRTLKLIKKIKQNAKKN